MMGIAAAPALLFFILLFTIPRSPRWLVSRNQTDEALAIFAQMGATNPKAELADIQAALQAEHATANQPVFQWKYRYPLFLAITIGAFNQLAGINAILYYMHSIFAAAGFGGESGYMQSIIVGATNLVFTLVGMSMIDHFGRKSLLIVGAIGTACCLGGVAWIFNTNSHQAALLGLLHDLCRFLRAIARLGHLGLHRRGISHGGPLQGPRRRRRQPLDHEHDHFSLLSCFGAPIQRRHTVSFLCHCHGGAVDRCDAVLSGDQRANAGATAAEAGTRRPDIMGGAAIPSSGTRAFSIHISALQYRARWLLFDPKDNGLSLGLLGLGKAKQRACFWVQLS